LLDRYEKLGGTAASIFRVEESDDLEEIESADVGSNCMRFEVITTMNVLLGLKLFILVDKY
jgi:hypothetical protein